MNSKIIRIAVSAICLTLLINGSFAQRTTPSAPSTATTDRVALHQALLDLTNPWTVMCIAAHPDDEDGTSLIVMRRKYGAHTVSLFSTFGEGGQNAIGPELYEELGAIRARETMAAAEIQGSEPHFLGLKDFGYSKSADEAFRFWGHDEALRRMVLQIRKLRPDVIITNHSATSNDHGHHQATARLELEAFETAADPKRFPEQLKDDVTAWQVQRLFVRARGANQTNNGSIVTIDPNERDPIRGTTFAEEALRGLQEHATQGPWPKTVAELARFRNSQDGKLPLTRYALVREAKGAQPLPKDAHNVLDGLRLPETSVKRVEPPTIGGRPLVDFVDQPQLTLEALTASLKHLQGPRSSSEIPSTIGSRQWRQLALLAKVNRAIALSNGITTKLVLRDKVLVPGRTAHLSFVISNNGHTALRPELTFAGISQTTDLPMFMSADFPRDLVIHPGKTIDIPVTALTPVQARPSVPHAQHLYDENLSRMSIGIGTFVEVGAAMISIVEVTVADVAPAVEITNLSPSPIVRTPAAINQRMMAAANCAFQDSDFNVRLTNHREEILSGALVSGTSTGRKTETRQVTLGPGQSVDVAAPISGCLPWIDSKKDELKAPEVSLTFIGNKATKPSARLDVPVIWADARVARNLRVGYIRGFDYSLPTALNALGVESTELSIDEVRTVDLQKYSTIIVDNRVYESQPELIATNQKLLDYAKNGGTLIVFYHKSNEWNPDERRQRPQLAPYKLILGEARITDETAPITFIEPQHPLLNIPNKMSQDDFANWIQERGLYYAKEWDPQFHALLQSNDPGEQPLRGGLLVADYGRGHYIYSSMVWYRQLRAGVPGAYRMLANMISYGRPPR